VVDDGVVHVVVAMLPVMCVGCGVGQAMRTHSSGPNKVVMKTPRGRNTIIAMRRRAVEPRTGHHGGRHRLGVVAPVGVDMLRLVLWSEEGEVARRDGK